MNSIFARLSSILLLLSTFSFGLDLIPDSVISKSRDSLIRGDLNIDTVEIKNASSAAITVDSILIRFLDGDSLDFKRGIILSDPGYYAHVYNGWTYGRYSKSLGCLRDSLFLLIDSIGRPVSMSIAPESSIEFVICLPVNCITCGRMPAYPKTTRYQYLFNSTGTSSDSLKVILSENTSVKGKFITPCKSNNPNRGNGNYILTGRKLKIAGQVGTGVIITKQSKSILVNRVDEKRVMEK